MLYKHEIFKYERIDCQMKETTNKNIYDMILKQAKLFTN